MKFKLRGNKVASNILDTVLYNRGIENIDLFMNPDNSSDSELNDIINIDKGIELIKKHINNEILILVDSDCDGITSGSMMFKYLKGINKDAKIDYFLHSEKKHGLTDEFMDYLGGKSFDLIIVPDAGSNDVENIEKVVKVYGADILIIDHHEIEKESKYGVIINNQICKNTNSNLTGAGLVYKFCQALNEIYKLDILEELSNLAMLGLIGDSADLVDNEVRNICLTSIKNIVHPFIKTFYILKEKDLNNIIMKDLSWGGVIPMINAVLRIGSIEEKIDLFEILAGIVDEEKIHIVTKRKLNKETRKYENIDFEMNQYEYIIEICGKVKARQDKLSKKYCDSLTAEYSSETGIQIFIVPNDYETKGITGLIANKLAEKFSQPTIVIWENDEGKYQGSLRGNEKVMPDFKAWCLETGLFDLVQGHPNAAGVVIDKENLELLFQEAKNVVPQEICYDVDYIYNEQIPIEDIYIIGNNKDLWGNGCKEPLFVLKNINIPKSAIQYTKSTLRIWINGITYIKFGVSELEIDKMKTSGGFSDSVRLTLVGTMNINEYNGNKYPQFMISDYEIVENNININEPAIFNIFG